MLTKFQIYIKGEIDELGEYALAWLIPRYLAIEKKHQILEPIDQSPENYKISDVDFEDLKKQISELIEKCNLGLYLYISGSKSQKWEDNFRLLTFDEKVKCFNEKEPWLDGKTQAIFIS
ncbi:MAG: hypothetical protein Q8M29_03100 [Bacteroidota bacterium]|nr:hypothetical protein [Bacteroidota bacterium]